MALNNRVQQRSAAFSTNADICPRGYDWWHWSNHPKRIEDDCDPFLTTWWDWLPPSLEKLRNAIDERRQLGERAWAYQELVEHVGIHEARLTNALSAAITSEAIRGPGVMFCDPGPNAVLPRDSTIHYFWLPDQDESVSIEVLRRFAALGLIDWEEAPAKRVPIARDLRALIWAKSNGHCWYCGIQTNPFDNFHVDHFIPVADGGTNEPGNLVPCCATCNISKGAKHIEAFRAARGGGLFWFEIARGGKA